MLRILEKVIELDESDSPLGRHAVMLVSLIVLLMALPLDSKIPDWLPIYPMLLSFVLLSAVFVNSMRNWVLWTAIAVGFIGISGNIYTIFVESLTVRVVSSICSMALMGFATLVMGNSLLRAKRVNMDTVIGGICVYLLIGILFAMGLILMVEFDYAAFTKAGETVSRFGANPDGYAKDLIYYSFVTLTTLGYGDITPRSDFAQMLAVAEALIGQLYLTVFLARLVASFVASGRQDLS